MLRSSGPGRWLKSRDYKPIREAGRFYEVGMKESLVAPLIALIVIATYAYAQSTQDQPKSIETVQDFVIGPEDVLMINVWREPDFTTKAVVRPDGKISVALLSDVQAGGLTTKEV